MRASVREGKATTAFEDPGGRGEADEGEAAGWASGRGERWARRRMGKGGHEENAKGVRRGE